MPTKASDVPHIDLRKLRFFVAVARSGSFVAASRDLRVSQPAVSYQIRELEAELRVQLLVRLARGIALTPAGKEFLLHSEDILDRLRVAAASVEPFRNQLSGEVSLGLTPTTARVLASALLETCEHLHELRIVFQQGLSDELHQKVASGSLDMTLCYDAKPMPGVRLVQLCYDDIYLIGLPDQLQDLGETVRFEELARIPLVLDLPRHSLRQIIEKTAAACGVRLRVDVESDTVSLKRGLISSRRCCTLVHFGLFSDEIERGALRAVRIVEPGIERTLYLALRQELADSTQNFMISAVSAIVATKIAEGTLRWRSRASAEISAPGFEERRAVSLVG